MKVIGLILGVLLIITIYTGCKSLASGANNLNAFTVADDKKLGDQVAAEIASKPADFPILPEQGNQEIYAYVRGLTSTILNSGKVKYKNEFPWVVKIVKDDKTLNAFCTPGGYIYLYTGLIKYLDSEDQLMGVLGHEIAHADERHSTEQLTKQYGIAFLADALLGNKSALEQIGQAVVGGLAGLSFSRANESEADNRSVEYLCGTSTNAAGAAGFFKKMNGEKQPPEFLSTHPNPTNRVNNIEKKAKSLNCAGSKTNTSVYKQKKALL